MRSSLRFEHDEVPDLAPVTGPEEIVDLQRARGTVVVSNDVRSYLVNVVRSTRQDDRLSLGASPRAALALHRAVQARALLQGRAFALPDDVKSLALPVLAHRLVLSPTARLRGATPGRVIDEILARLAVPVEDESDEEASAP